MISIGLITLIATLVISLLITRIGAVALTLTGLAPDVARFQARSAYTGVGYTTRESEQIVNHPVRRRIMAGLMLTGNVGIAVVIASMMATFAEGANIKESSTDLYIRVGGLLLALALLAFVGTRRWVDQGIEAVITWALRNWTHLDVRDYVSLLNLANGYVVVQITVQPGDWVAEKPLSETRLSAEGVLVLGIWRTNGDYLGSPSGHTLVHNGDVLSVYGPESRLEEFGLRKSGFQGDQAHQEAVAAHQKNLEKEEQASEETDLKPS